MRRRRLILIGSAGGLAQGFLAAAVWAQNPGPVTLPPPGPQPRAVVENEGPLKRAAHHTWRVLQDNWIGYPDEFIEPPPGFYNEQYYRVMKAKANPHRFMLYRSDFLPGETRLSPSGASRFNIMAAKLRGWLGPIVVEWTPDDPQLADARKAAVVSLLQSGGVAVVAERVVVGPSPFPGQLGADAVGNYTNFIDRNSRAARSYSLTPNSTGGSFSSGGGGGSAGGP